MVGFDSNETLLDLAAHDPDFARAAVQTALLALLALLALPPPADARSAPERRTSADVRLAAATAVRQLEERKLIERATGILMRRTGTTEQEAYRILQRSS